MSSTERSEIRDAIERVFIEQLGGQASLDEVFRQLIGKLPEHLEHHVLATGLKAQIGAYFRAKRKDGLPQAPEVNDDGIHKQLDLLEVPEFQYVIGQYLKASSASYVQARKLATLCVEVHGVAIDLDQLAESA